MFTILLSIIYVINDDCHTKCKGVRYDCAPWSLTFDMVSQQGFPIEKNQQAAC